MGLFKSKAEKEQERKMLVKKSMRELEKRIVKLKEQEGKYIQAAQLAIREQLPDQEKLAKEALKMTISERKRTYKMLLNAQIISQMKENNISLPLIAIGGITKKDIPSLMQTGINGIALSGSILRSENPIEEMKEIIQTTHL